MPKYTIARSNVHSIEIEAPDPESVLPTFEEKNEESLTPRWHEQALLLFLQDYRDLLPWCIVEDKRHLFIAKLIGDSQDYCYFVGGNDFYLGNSHQEIKVD